MLLETSGVNITTPNHLAAYFYFLLTYLEETVTKIHHYYLQRYYFFLPWQIFIKLKLKTQAKNSRKKLNLREAVSSRQEKLKEKTQF